MISPAAPATGLTTATRGILPHQLLGVEPCQRTGIQHLHKNSLACSGTWDSLTGGRNADDKPGRVSERCRKPKAGGGREKGPYTIMLIVDTPMHETFLGIAIQCQQHKAKIGSFSDIFINDIGCLSDSAPHKLLTLLRNMMMDEQGRDAQ
jgi:hypothetical protein